MPIKEGIRTGGRSARVQESVHAAVRALLQEQDRSTLTVPQVAARAGVTPSTIYRRWGELVALLADVALERLRPDTAPADTGSLRGDLLAWAEQYLDEMSSDVGRNMMRDVISSACPGYCTRILRSQLQVILARAERRGEALPDLDRLLDLLVAPTVFRILFAEAPPSLEQLHGLVDLALA
ncbi:Bacterial regulatory protein, tetR family [compost metagenome]|uniref:TetR/AcrR family transcriptional regulator n=1 Tax=Pseudomonas TaxID=286 RepID=UPI0003FB4F5E|nr:MULTISPECIES: TetR/AcrR family transcriptional regulator [Pseudomonas]MCW2270234.1 AcrR family transcriptional regulator [Pseudomonas sp. JUb96]PRA66434.1 TetR/AcrR family transcriptional regulator [Pseudomonas sp. MYb187]